MEGDGNLATSAMEVGDLLDDGLDLEQEIGDACPQTAINLEKLLPHRFEKEPRNCKKNAKRSGSPSKMA